MFGVSAAESVLVAVEEIENEELMMEVAVGIAELVSLELVFCSCDIQRHDWHRIWTWQVPHKIDHGESRICIRKMQRL